MLLTDREAREEQAILMAEPVLEKVCKRHWKKLEYEDRLAEARYALVLALRSRSTGTGNFMDDFAEILHAHMEQMNGEATSLYYGTISLDAAKRTRNNAKQWTAYHFISAAGWDESKLCVQQFLESCPEAHQQILQDLLSGVPKAEIARKNGLTDYQLKLLLQELGRAYLREFS